MFGAPRLNQIDNGAKLIIFFGHGILFMFSGF
jgi:hypothetical protein